MTRRPSDAVSPARPDPPRTIRSAEASRPARPGVAAVAAFVAIVTAAAAHIAYLRFVCDDAFISFRYAEHLAMGDGIVFNVGERVEGYTNFLWVLVCAGLIRLGLAPESGALWIGAAAALATLAAGFAFLAFRGRTTAAVAFGVMLAGSGSFAAWATGGLETALFAAFAFAAFVSLVSVVEAPDAETARPRGPLLWSAGFLLLATLTRPEGLLLTGVAGVFLGVRALRRRLAGRDLVLWSIVWLVPFAAYLAWRVVTFGRWLPNTFAVKAGGTSLLPTGLAYLSQYAERQHLWLWLVPVAFVFIVRRRPGFSAAVWALGLGWIVPYLAYVAVVGGDFMDMGRFVVPILPVAAFLIAGACEAAASALAARWQKAAVLAVAVTLVGAYAVLNMATSRDSVRPWHRGVDSIGLLRRYAEDWTLAAVAISRMAQPGDSIAITAAGIIPYRTRLYTIDQLGLVATDLSGYRTRSAARMPGHGLIASGELLQRLRPQFILGHPVVVDSLKNLEASLMLDPSSHREVMKSYRVVTAQTSADPPRYFAFAMRRDLFESRSIAVESVPSDAP